MTNLEVSDNVTTTRTYGRIGMPEAMVASRASDATGSAATQQVDVAVVGAAFAGLYLLHRLRKPGFSTALQEEADDVGSPCYWNRYPGPRCAIPPIVYR